MRRRWRRHGRDGCEGFHRPGGLGELTCLLSRPVVAGVTKRDDLGPEMLRSFPYPTFWRKQAMIFSCWPRCVAPTNLRNLVVHRSGPIIGRTSCAASQTQRLAIVLWALQSMTFLPDGQPTKSYPFGSRASSPVHLTVRACAWCQAQVDRCELQRYILLAPFQIMRRMYSFPILFRNSLARTCAWNLS